MHLKKLIIIFALCYILINVNAVFIGQIEESSFPIEETESQIEEAEPQILELEIIVSENGDIDYAYSNEYILEPRGYIVQFFEDPILVKKTQLEIQGIVFGNILNEQRNLISGTHNTFKEDLANINSNYELLGEFDTLFNGIAIEVSEDEIEAVKNLSYVKEVFPNNQVKALLDESVPAIHANEVWGLGYTGEGINIAILDSGVDYTHPSLGGCFGVSCKVYVGWDFVNNDADPIDDYGHGTHVAGIAAGNGVLKGVAPDAKIIAAKVLNSSGRGYWSDIIAALELSMDPNNDDDYSDHVDIVNMSLGGSGNPDDAMSQTVNNAVDAGVVVVVSAGNGGPMPFSIGSPGTAKKAITVASASVSATNPYISSFSSRGIVVWESGSLLKPDISAPGEKICAAQHDDYKEGYAECSPELDNHIAISGTSMASPHVAGISALLLQAHPEWTPSQIKTAIMSSASMDIFPKSSSYTGAGYANALDAINFNASVYTTTPNLSFGIIGEGQTIWTKTLPVILKNTSLETIEYEISLIDNYGYNDEIGPGISVEYDSQITINPNSDKSFDVKLTVDNEIVSGPREYGEYTLVLTSPKNTIRIPIWFKKARFEILFSPAEDIPKTNSDLEIYVNSDVELKSAALRITKPNGESEYVILELMHNNLPVYIANQGEVWRARYTTNSEGEHKVEAGAIVLSGQILVSNSLANYNEAIFIADFTAPDIKLEINSFSDPISLTLFSNENIASNFDVERQPDYVTLEPSITFRQPGVIPLNENNFFEVKKIQAATGGGKSSSKN